MTKTMGQYIINGIITTVGSLIVALTASFYVFNREADVALVEKVETLDRTKADKIEVENLRKETEKKITDSENRIINHMNNRFDDTQQMIQLIIRK